MEHNVCAEEAVYGIFPLTLMGIRSWSFWSDIFEAISNVKCALDVFLCRCWFKKFRLLHFMQKANEFWLIKMGNLFAKRHRPLSLSDICTVKYGSPTLFERQQRTQSLDATYRRKPSLTQRLFGRKLKRRVRKHSSLPPLSDSDREWLTRYLEQNCVEKQVENTEEL